MLLKNRDELLERMCVLLGGRVAEELYFENVTTGASDDIEKLTALAYQFVGNFAMGRDTGTFCYNRKNRYYSEVTREKIDMEVKQIIKSCYDRTKTLMKKNTGHIKKMAEALLEKETLNQEEIVELFSC